MKEMELINSARSTLKFLGPTSYFLDQVSKPFAVAVGLAYVSGVIVTTIHLSRFGVSSFSLLRTQHLLAGFWCLLPLFGAAISLSWAFAGYYVGIDESEPGKSAFRKIIVMATSFIKGIASAWMFWVLIGMLTLFYLQELFPYRSLGSFFDGTFWIILKVSGFSIFISFTFYLSIISMEGTSVLKDGRRENTSAAEKGRLNISLGVQNASVAFLALIWYVLFFSTQVYSKIPLELGGGAPQHIGFLLRDPNVAPLVIVDKQSDAKSGPFELVLVTDESYFVRPTGSMSGSMEIRKELVAGIQPYPRKQN